MLCIFDEGDWVIAKDGKIGYVALVTATYLKGAHKVYVKFPPETRSSSVYFDFELELYNDTHPEVKEEIINYALDTGDFDFLKGMA